MTDKKVTVHVCGGVPIDAERSTDEGKCPKCGGEIECGYGLAAGGIGGYMYCVDCEWIGDFSPDPELSTPEEMERHKQRSQT